MYRIPQRRMVLRVGFVVLLWISPMIVAENEATAGQIRVTLESISVQLGEPVPLRIEIPAEFADDLPTEFPPLMPSASIRLKGVWVDRSEGLDAPGVWTGSAVFYELGEIDFPVLFISGENSPRSEVITVTVSGRLEDAVAEDPESLADLKGPASLAPALGRWLMALAGLLGLLLVGWIVKRYFRNIANRLRAEAIVTDRFDRLPPHEWAFREIKALLAKHWAEQGEYDRFYTRLSWILRRYLGGRFRVELMEHTTTELLPLLGQVGAAGDWLERLPPLFEEFDRVKFAAGSADPDRCREAVEESYRLIDESRPQRTDSDEGNMETTEVGT